MCKGRGYWTTALLAAMGLAMTPAELPAAETPTIITPSQQAVTLDGKLDDPIWRDAQKFTPFRVLGDVTRASAWQNEAMMAIKDGYLYIAYRLEEPNPAGMQAMKVDRDTVGAMQDTAGIWADDCTETFLSIDRKSWADILVNAAGTNYWNQNDVEKPAVTWYPVDASRFNGDWAADAVIGEDEWTCEIRVKISDLFKADVGGDQTLYVNFTRHRTQGDEENLTWAPLKGKRYAEPSQFVPVTLRLPKSEQKADVLNKGLDPVFTNKLGVPDLMLAGAPVKLTETNERFALPADLTIDAGDMAIDAGVMDAFKHAVARGAAGQAGVVLRVADVFDDASLSADEKAKLQSPEAFKLTLKSGEATITGRTREGVLRGMATLMLMANRGRFMPNANLPSLVLYDAPRMAYRGWMLSGHNSKEELQRAIDVAFLLRMNKVMIALGSYSTPTAFPFDSYPIGDKSRTKQEFIDIFNYARARGIEPIPYMSPWNRTQYLKVTPGGEALLAPDPDNKAKGTTLNLDAANPAAAAVMLGLMEEIIDTLHPENFCIAMDEVHYAPTLTSPAAQEKGWSVSDWFVACIDMTHELFSKKGVTLSIWGDMIDPDYNGRYMDMCGEELLARLPKDIVIYDWKYDGRLDPTVDFTSVKLFTDAGFKTVGCPWFRPKNVPRVAHSVAKYGGEGLLLTSWNSTRLSEMLPSVVRAVGLSAYYGWSPENVDLQQLKFLPEAITEAAAYWNDVPPVRGEVRSLSADQSLVFGGKLASLLGLPAESKTDFLATPFENYRGVWVKIFEKDGQPAAVMGEAPPESERGVSIVNGDFSQGLKGWTVKQPKGSEITVENQRLTIMRISGNEFMRAYQDIRLDPEKKFYVRYRIKVDGPGHASVWTYNGDENMKWDEASIRYYRTPQSAWSKKQIELPAGLPSLRLNFAASGDGTTVWVDDVEIVEAGARSAGGDKAKRNAQTASIPVNAKARVVTFMHAANAQDVAADYFNRGPMDKFQNQLWGQYRICYTDGDSVLIPLVYRVDIAPVNYPGVGRATDIGLFGTVGGEMLMNLPTYTWVNPHPEKKIVAIDVLAGGMPDVSLLVFGVAIESVE